MTLTKLRTLFAVASVLLLALATEPSSADTRVPACDQSKIRKFALSVNNKDGLFLETLSPADLLITENKVAVEILGLESRTNQPVSAVILIDTSVSQEQTLVQSMLAANKFVEWILRNKKDRAALVSFSGDAVVEVDLTDDRTRLLGGISRLSIDRPPDYLPGGVVIGRTPPIRPRRQGTTAMWDAVWASTDGILKTVRDSRRVTVLFTDGEDSSSTLRIKETIQFAAGNEVTVFAIGMNDKAYYLFGRGNLEALSEDTGGRSFFPKKVQNIPEILQKTELQVRSHYVISYCSAGGPPSADSASKIHVDLKNPQLRQSNLRLSYRRYIL